MEIKNCTSSWSVVLLEVDTASQKRSNDGTTPKWNNRSSRSVLVLLVV